MIVFNETELPVKENHICWNVRADPYNSNTYILEEIVEKYYRHPEAPEDALVVKYDKNTIKEIDEKSSFYPAIHLFMNAKKNIDLIIEKIKE